MAIVERNMGVIAVAEESNWKGALSYEDIVAREDAGEASGADCSSFVRWRRGAAAPP